MLQSDVQVSEIRFLARVFRRTESPAYRGKNREFRRFSSLPKSVSKTSAKAVCTLSSLRDRTGKQFTTTGKQFRLIGPEQGIERQIDPRSDEALVPRLSLCGAVADDYGSAVPWTKRSGGDRSAGWTVPGGGRRAVASPVRDLTGPRGENHRPSTISSCSWFSAPSPQERKATRPANRRNRAQPAIRHSARRTDPTIPDPIDETGQPLARIRT